MLFLLGGVAISGITGLYGYGASEGWLGDEARAKYLTQSSGNMGILLGARNEILASAQAIIDSPVIGHGSWAKDPKYADILVSALGQHGYEIQGESESDLIPSHSYIMGAWVEAGFVGAVFWLWALMLTARVLIATQGANSALAPLIAFVAFSLLWNIPFSHFGAEGRLYTAYDLSLMMFALTLSRSSVAKKGPT
jgi:O-antigen ligase